MPNNDKLDFTASVDTPGVDDKITKEQFRKYALSAVDSVTAVTDEIWQSALVTVTIRFRNSYEVVIGIRDAEEPDDEYEERMETLNRYEAALARIADGSNFGSPLQAIAAKALGRPPSQEEDDDV